MKLAGVPFAVKNLFDVAGLPTLAGIEDRARRRAGGARRGAGAPPGGRRRGAGRRAEHGRVRLRLHHREHALRRHAQPARPDAHERRLVGRLGRGGGGRAGAADAGLRHQRLDPRAGLAVRHLRPETHLRPAAAHRQLPLRRQPRPPGPVRAQRGRPGAGLRRDAGPPTRDDPACAQRGVEPVSPLLEQRHRRACASACSAAGSARWRWPRPPPRSTRWRRRWARRGWSSCPRWNARAPRPSSITCGEGGALHLDDLRKRAARTSTR